LDDDVIDAWDRELLIPYKALPDVGFLAANLVNDPHDATARVMYGANRHQYEIEEINGFRLKVGPVGGWCAMTDRDLYNRVGGFSESDRWTFWSEDADYIRKIKAAGSHAALLEPLLVHHAGGEYYSPLAPEKIEFWTDYFERRDRRNEIKSALLRIPGMRALNRRFSLFVDPAGDTAVWER
jgi:GT2 family glycosyltransferase